LDIPLPKLLYLLRWDLTLSSLEELITKITLIVTLPKIWNLFGEEAIVLERPQKFGLTFFTVILYYGPLRVLADYCFLPGFAWDYGAELIQDDPDLFDVNIKVCFSFGF